MIGHWSNKAVQNEIKLYPFKTIEKSLKLHKQVDTSQRIKTFSPEEISATVLTKKKEIVEVFPGNTKSVGRLSLSMKKKSSQKPSSKSRT